MRLINIWNRLRLRQYFALLAALSACASGTGHTADQIIAPWIAVTHQILAGSGAEETTLRGNVIQSLEPAGGEREHDVYFGDFLALTYAVAHAKYHFSDYAGDEFVYVQKGVVTLVDDTSNARHTFKKGDFFVVPKGWKGIWSTPRAYREWIILGKGWEPFFKGQPVSSGVVGHVTPVALHPGEAEDRMVSSKLRSGHFSTAVDGNYLRSATLYDGADLMVMLVDQTAAETYRYKWYPGDTYIHVLFGSVILNDGYKRRKFTAGHDFIITHAFHGSVRLSAGYRALMVSDKKFFAPSAAAAAAAIVGQTDPAAIFATRCAACHDLHVLAPTLPQISRLTEGQIEYALWHGVMKEYANGLSGGQRAMVAAWIAGLNKRKLPRSPGVRLCRNTKPWTPAPAADWPGWSRGVHNTRLVDDPEITGARMRGTRLIWALPLPVETDFDGAANPVAVVGNRLFMGNYNGWVYAIDVDNQCALWTFKPLGPVRSNVAVRDGVLVFGDVYANAYALDANTGRLLWIRPLDSSPEARVTGNVTLDRGVAYFPVSSFSELAGIRPTDSCCSFRGSVVAIDARTGVRKWKTYTIGQPLKIIGRTARGAVRYGPSGVPVWSGVTVNNARSLIYVATGNQWTGPQVRESDSVMALDMQSGHRRWVTSLAPQQMGGKDIYVLGCEAWIDPERTVCSPKNPKGEGDRDLSSPPELVTLKDGHQLLLAASKDGMFYALDPDTGSLRWKVRVGHGGDLGGVEYGFSSDNERAYIPVSDVNASNLQANGAIVAVDLSIGKIVWRISGDKNGCRNKPTPPCNSAFLSPTTVVGDIVLAGSNDGILHAYLRNDGREVWSFDAVRPFSGSNGLSGTGGSFGFGGPVVSGHRIYVMSGDGYLGLGLPGNVLLGFKIP